MDTAIPSSPALSEEQAAFIQAHVTMVVASRDAALRPRLVRAIGCRLSDDRRALRLYVSCRQSRDVQAAIGETGAVAAFFTRPRTHRSLQLKGRDATLQALDAQDRAALARYRALCGEELAALGYGADFTRALLAVELDDAMVIGFTPDSVFEQTPGPGAGQRIEAGA